MNIITKENKNYPLAANASVYTESVGIFNFDGGISYNHKNNSFSLSGGRNFFGGFSQNDSLRSEQWKPKRQYFLDGYYMFSHPDLKVKLSSSYFNEKLLSKGNLLPPYFETAFDSYFYTVRSTSKIELVKQWSNHRFMDQMPWRGL